MKLRYWSGIVLLVLAIGGCLLLGTVGWFIVGFGIMTDCTNNYSCTTSGCTPCASAGRWITLGGVAQWLLAVAAVVVMVTGIRARNGTRLLAGGLAVLALSVTTVVATTWLADRSYCQPGTPGYADSYCSVEL